MRRECDHNQLTAHEAPYPKVLYVTYQYLRSPTNG